MHSFRNSQRCIFSIGKRSILINNGWDWIICLLFFSISMGLHAQEAIPFTNDSIKVTVGDFMPAKGLLVVRVYDSASYGPRIPRFEKIVPITGDNATVYFVGIPRGKYSITAYHDVNNDSKFDFRVEDYGLSNGAKPKFGRPSFRDASFIYEGKNFSMNIRLENEKARKSEHYVSKTVFSPVVSYAPETSVLLGVNLIRFFKFYKKDTVSRTSYIDLFGAATFKGQILLDFNHQFFSDREKYMIIGSLGFQRYPQYYYGVGNILPQSNQETVNYSQVKIEELLLRNIYKKLFAGLGYRYVNLFNVSSPSSGELQESHVTGYQGSAISGVVFCVSSDSRDNVYNTHKGHLARVKYGVYSPFTGSAYQYTTLEADLRGFIKPIADKDHVLAAQAYGYFSTGNVPWNEMGALGSDMIMRGYYSGRYRDKNYMAAQIEYRYAINKQYGLVAFAGLGEVAGAVSGFNTQGIKPNGGLGFRFKLDRSERLNLRLDWGFGQQTNNFYFTVAEAF